MSYLKYSRAQTRHWHNLGQAANEFLDHYERFHSVENITLENGLVRTRSGLQVTEGQALVQELVESDYILVASFRSYWDLFSRSKLLKDEHMLSFVGRSLLEIYERRVSFLLFAPPHVRDRQKIKYMFTSAHLWASKIHFAELLISQMISDNPSLRNRSNELRASVERGKLKPVMKEMGFDSPQYAQYSGRFLSSEPESTDNRSSIFAFYSLAIHGDPFAATAIETGERNDGHFLLAKTLQLFLSFECSTMMVDNLGVDDCETCLKYRREINRQGKVAKKYFDTNSDTLTSARIANS